MIMAMTGWYCAKSDIGNMREIHRAPGIEPDYTETVIPPNIAPLDFMIKEPGIEYRVDIIGTDGNPVEIHSTGPKIIIPMSEWKDVLARNKGKEIRFVISVLDSQKQWIRFDPIHNHIAQEEIDRYLVYRLMPPLYMLWKTMGIYQRDISSFDVKQIFKNRPMNDGCFNCHSFLHNSPDTWMVHTRLTPLTGMLLTTGGKTVFVKTQTEFNRAPAGHPAWHPGGKYLAFSVYKVRQFFHSEGVNRDALDMVSDLILYNVESNTITACQSIADSNRFETYPTWSPDGRWLYFCSTQRFDSAEVFQNNFYKTVKYDMMRIEFDPQTAAFGKLETFLASSETGKSITFPRFSPDGRFLLFTMSEYGSFPLARSGGHLYMMDMASRQISPLACNDGNSDSYHSWSSNGRWIVFSSRREDGICTRPYFSYIDEQGNARKAFVLPQEDPTFYETTLKTFNIPELITGPIQQSPQKLLSTALDEDQALKATFAPSKK
jgi:hypothetical protein